MSIVRDMGVPEFLIGQVVYKVIHYFSYKIRKSQFWNTKYKKKDRTAKLFSKLKHLLQPNNEKRAYSNAFQQTQTSPPTEQWKKSIRQSYSANSSISSNRTMRNDRTAKLFSKFKHLLQPNNEKNFSWYNIVNSQNNCCSVPQDLPIVMKTKHSVHIALFGVVTSDSDIIPPLIFPRGLRLKTEMVVLL